jgi:hypothetical protein
LIGSSGQYCRNVLRCNSLRAGQQEYVHDPKEWLPKIKYPSPSLSLGERDAWCDSDVVGYKNGYCDLEENRLSLVRILFKKPIHDQSIWIIHLPLLSF